jgi:hypothetical protein
MVKIDLQQITNNIKNWSEEELIANATVKFDHWNPDVQNIIKSELQIRNIPQESIIKIENEERNKEILKDMTNNNGIKGWLLVFLVSIIFAILSLFINLSRIMGSGNYDYSSVIKMILISFYILTALLIIKKKKSAIKLAKAIIYLSMIAILIVSIKFIISFGFTIFLLIPGIGLLHCFAWLEYFNNSKRIINTLVN